MRTDVADRFSVRADGYRYGDHGIYISTKERRQRIFIELTDGNAYARQLEIRLIPRESSIDIQAPIDVRVRRHDDYTAHIGLAMGMRVMFTTDEGRTYGEEFWKRHSCYVEWLKAEHTRYQNNITANSGRKKYETEKRRRENGLHSYINCEINRLLRTEKPGVIYVMKFPRDNVRCGAKAVGYLLNRWQRGYIRKRLEIKCREHSIEFIEVYGRGIADECSRCGAIGKRENGLFVCECGYTALEKHNTARNIKKRGEIGSKNLRFA